MAHPAPSEATVVVVGAGMAGLTAARELHLRGVDVVVLEAADCLGGRAMSEPTSLGSWVDLGGQWIGHDHHRIMALAKEFDSTYFTMHTQLLPALVDGPRRLPAQSMVGQRRGGVVAAQGARTPGATTPGSAGPDLVDGRPRPILRSSDAQDDPAAGRPAHGNGNQGWSPGLAAGAGSCVTHRRAGRRTRPASLARAAGRHNPRDGCGRRGAAPAGDIAAAKVIVTAPPPMAARIAYDPSLPEAPAALQHNSYMGSVYKAIAVYDKPFWREQKGVEFIVLDRPGRAVFDTTPPDGPGHLCILVAGQEARELDALDSADRRNAMLGTLAQHVGQEVLQPVDWHEKAWHQDE